MAAIIFDEPIGRWPRRLSYPLLGIVLAQGAPCGLLLLRSLVAGRAPTAGWIAAETISDLGTYLYLALSTTAVFAILGAILGAAHDRLAATSLQDPLTGLANRRLLHARVRDEVARADRTGAPLALLLVDIDGLKAINDRGGHRAGDQAIRIVGEAIRGVCRRTDLAARQGGDELAVVAPATTAADALALAERIRARLARTLAPAGAVVPTVSIGVADLERSGERSPEALYGAADAALYEAKSSGRDRALLAARLAGRARAEPAELGRPDFAWLDRADSGAWRIDRAAFARERGERAAGSTP